jgi:hypothetical protein
MVPKLQEELGPDHNSTVVLRVCSAGGPQTEIQPIADVLQEEYQTRWHVVAWIDSAINSAAMSVHGLEDIYFTPQGNYGGCTYFHGWGLVRHPDLEAQLTMMAAISKRGKHNTLIMRAMQVQVPLSATVDDHNQVTWYADATSGAILVNRPHEILTLNSQTAAQVKFSKGTASTLADLTTQMGYKELNWLGSRDSATLWPVCKAERWNIEWRRQTNRDEDQINQSCRRFQMAVQRAETTPRRDRDKPVDEARQALARFMELVARRPALAAFKLGFTSDKELLEWHSKQERFLTSLLAPLPPALAARQTLDAIHLKDGRTFIGTITREEDGCIWLEYSLGDLHHKRMFKADEIASISRRD